MAPRKRTAKKRHLPENLYEQDGYYSWRNPITGQRYGIGTDLSKARTEAIAANIHIATHQPPPSLVERLSGAVKTWGDWCDKYDAILAKRDIKANTRKAHKSYGKRARALGEDIPFRSITVQVIADALDELVNDGKARTAQAFQSYLKDSFREANAQGWTEHNPAALTRKVQAKVHRARLSLEHLKQILDEVKLVWLRNAICLALVTAQRREDISNMKFKDAKDGALWVDQGKNGAKVVIPLDISLGSFGMSLAGVLSQCRSTGIVSPYVIHQTVPRGNSPRGSQIFIDRISKAFAAAIKALGIDWGDKTPPSFHEIRSLSLRLYKQQGNVNTQELAGHKDPSTTAVYEDARGEWVKVGVK